MSPWTHRLKDEAKSNAVSAPHNRDQVYRSLCLTLGDQSDAVDRQPNWQAYSATDWDLLVTMARTEGVAPLMYHTFRTTDWPAPMSDHHRHQLQTAYYAAAAHNLLIHQELTRILAALANQPTNKQIILLKGIALGPTLYPDQALRPVSDIDLLLPREQIDTTVQTVKSLGYRTATPEMAAGHNEAAGHHVHLRGGPEDSVAVELHWNLVSSDTDWRTPPMDWFWSQTEEWKMESGKGKMEGGRGKVEKGKWKREKGEDLSDDVDSPPSDVHSPFSNLQPTSSILQLTPTAHLLYLAAHLMLQHGGAQARLIWYYDLHLLIGQAGDRLDPSTGSGLRWEELLARAREFRWAPALHAALEGTQERFGTPLPAGFLDALAETQDQQAARSVARRAGPVQTRAVRTWDTLAAKSWRARLRHAWTLACPSPEYVRWRYEPQPAWLWPFYYPYRWLDILRDGLTTVWRIVRRS